MSTEDVPIGTEWKQAQAEHRRLATIVIDSNDAVTVQDFEGQLTAWNRGAERMYGYTESEALSMNIRDIVPGDRCDEALEFVGRIARDEDVKSLETQRISKDGRTLDVWLTVTKLVDEAGKSVAVATTERDVTERKKAEEVNRRLSSLVTSTADAVVALEMDGTITHWNTAANRLFGYSREEAIGQNVRMLAPPDRAHEFQYIVERLQRGETVEGFETVRTHQDGRSKHVSLTESLIRTPGGQVVGVSAIMRDISERKRFEQQLAVLTETERQRIGRELHDTTGQELTGLGFMAQSVLEQLAAESHPAEETVRKMEESIQRALAQVRRFAQGLVPVELDAAGLMAALQELATNTTEACNIPCTFRRNQPVSMEDNTMATQIYLIAKEAVANVIKHAHAEHVEIELSREDSRVTLLVRDDGVGIGEPTEEDGMGLRIMSHRAALIQATLEIERVDRGGTLVKCVLTT